MDKKEIILSKPLPIPVEAFEQHFVVHRLWDAPSLDALLNNIGPRVQGIAWSGPGNLDEALFARMPSLEIVANFGVGYDSVDATAAQRNQVVVTNTPDVLTEDVADLALGLLLATVRRLPQADRFARDGQWLEAPFVPTASLQGRRVGIVGLGKIGKAIARRCEAFNLDILYHGRTRQPDVAYEYRGSIVELARDTDILILVTPGTPETRRMVNREVLDALGPNGMLINVSRGSVVDEDDLIESLERGGILAAGLDVFENEPDFRAELKNFDNVVLLPHIGSCTGPTRQAMGQLVLDNLTQWFAGQGPVTPVPETPWQKAG